MPSPVLVTGGTGRLGRRVVPRLRDAGWELRVLTRGRRQATDGVQFLVGDLRASHRRRWLLPIGSREPAPCGPAACCHHQDTPPATGPGSSS
jgi:nucleoside-diphosphate-sugar epimerase